MLPLTALPDIPLRLAVFATELILTIGCIVWIRSTLRGNEPLRFVFQLLGFGALAAVVSAVVELRYSVSLPQALLANPQLYDRYGSWYVLLNNFTASLIEELAKYLVALVAVMSRRHFYKLSTAIVYLILIGLGFSLIEDAIFLLNPSTIAPYRLISFFVHSGTSAIVGYNLGRFRFGLARYRDLALALSGAVLLHFAYNLSASLPYFDESMLITVGITAFITSKIFTLFRRTLHEEYRLEQELFTPTPHTLLNVGGRRPKASLQAVRHVGANAIGSSRR